jgi:hypothetical protein
MLGGERPAGDGSHDKSGPENVTKCGPWLWETNIS